MFARLRPTYRKLLEKKKNVKNNKATCNGKTTPDN